MFLMDVKLFFRMRCVMASMFVLERVRTGTSPLRRRPMGGRVVSGSPDDVMANEDRTLLSDIHTYREMLPREPDERGRRVPVDDDMQHRTHCKAARTVTAPD